MAAGLFVVISASIADSVREFLSRNDPSDRIYLVSALVSVYFRMTVAADQFKVVPVQGYFRVVDIVRSEMYFMMDDFSCYD